MDVYHNLFRFAVLMKRIAGLILTLLYIGSLSGMMWDSRHSSALSCKLINDAPSVVFTEDRDDKNQSLCYCDNHREEGKHYSLHHHIIVNGKVNFQRANYYPLVSTAFIPPPEEGAFRYFNLRSSEPEYRSIPVFLRNCVFRI